MAHFNFVISQNAKWGHDGFYIDCHRMTSLVRYRKIFFYKKALDVTIKTLSQSASQSGTEWWYFGGQWEWGRVGIDHGHRANR